MGLQVGLATSNLEMRLDAFALVFLAGAQPSHGYLMGRAGLPFTNAAFREATTQTIQPSDFASTLLPTAVSPVAVRAEDPSPLLAASIPEALRSLQALTSSGGMGSTSNQFGQLLEECRHTEAGRHAHTVSPENGADPTETEAPVDAGASV